jgi:hypothetical protein
VVRDHAEHGLVRPDAEEGGPEERPRRQVHEPHGLVGQHAGQPGLAGARRRLGDGQRRAPWGDHLLDLPGHHAQRGAQRLVPGDDRVDGGGEGPGVQRATQAVGLRHVVGRAGRQEAIEEPQPLLAGRGRHHEHVVARVLPGDAHSMSSSPRAASGTR